ncbi:L-cysteine desulfidase family protein [Hespellia stercorisuis]|uniref:UPF0597 protein SAMN02745243_04073 n=1 Tax=Hespellia stercorisuis DSM 15480 TaxID=1121950 RepID=A0A1M6WQD0_9FIRM|nr:L-serine ammonia-lyase, iron-sulfur-dependent, subunit alpha [Hespellia stercorisuis]SHK95866.1 L-cysteine desulfidase [Hespellia stercorisuis DSM 15480]
MEKTIYDKYVCILKEELIPAMGCTEPIALAYAAAKGRELLGRLPERVVVKASGSIIKNTKSVVVPNTNQMRGIPVAVAAGIVGGKPELELQVISKMNTQEIEDVRNFVETIPIEVEALDDGFVFDILIEQHWGELKSVIRIVNSHLNIVYIEKNGKVYLDCVSDMREEKQDNFSVLSMEGIWDFVNHCDLKDVEEPIKLQMELNWAIAMEGMRQQYGANIGKVLNETYGNDIHNLACALAAAGSDARMNGCELPVVVNSGSGNQGITVSVPVMAYAEAMNIHGKKVIRALLLSNLIALYEKVGIGRLSAYCGAVSAGASAAAGIAYLNGEGYDTVIHTVVNALAASSGIICDGAKASCAAKIAIAVYTGLMGYEMYKKGQQFYAGDGIVGDGIEETLKNVGDLASKGMLETNNEIIKMMTKERKKSDE